MDQNESQASFYVPLPVAMTSAVDEWEKPESVPESMSEKWVESMVPGKQQAQSAFRSKVDGKVVQLDNPVVDSQTIQEKKQERKKKRQKKALKPLSSRERRTLGLYDIPKSQQKYELYIPLHQLWTEYIQNVLNGISSPMDCMAKLVKADFHGCILQVTRSTCPSHIGLQGIVIKDTKNMFCLITEKNVIKSVPKTKHAFSFTVSSVTYTLYGDAFCIRPAERVSRKFKATPTIDF